jgi:hypothetical protein
MRSYFGGRSGANNGVILPRRTIDVFVIEGRKLALNGVNKTCSPYVRVKFGNKKYRTQVRHKQGNLNLSGKYLSK